VEHLRRAKDEMDRRYAERLDIATLARTALASEAHFIRSFKREFGETPHSYLQRRRIERASDLLRETDRTVTEISLDVGFQSISWFTTAFKEVMGETPTAYRDRLRGAPPELVPRCFTMMWTRRAVFRKPDDGPANTVER
jgi:AraC-like DNA-binding protein